MNELWQAFIGLIVGAGIGAFVVIFTAQGWYYSIKNFFKKLFKKD